MKAKLTLLDADTVRVELKGATYLVASECPHRKGRMQFAHVNERALTIACPLHRSVFDLRTGRVVGGPACAPLRVVPCHGERRP